MALNAAKKIVRQSRNLITMPFMAIARVKTLGGYQPTKLTYTDIHVCFVEDVEIPGVLAK